MSENSENDKKVSEAEATSDDGSRYRTLTVNKSGESTDDE